MCPHLATPILHLHTRMFVTLLLESTISMTHDVKKALNYQLSDSSLWFSQYQLARGFPNHAYILFIALTVMATIAEWKKTHKQWLLSKKNLSPVIATLLSVRLNIRIVGDCVIENELEHWHCWITPVQWLLSQYSNNCKCLAIVGGKPYKSLILGIKLVFSSIFHIVFFYILPQYGCLFLKKSLRIH